MTLALHSHACFRRVAARDAWAAHPKPRGADRVPPLVRRGTNASSVFVHDKSAYADALRGDVLRYDTSVNPLCNADLRRLADARETVTVVALSGGAYYVARGTFEHDSSGNFRIKLEKQKQK
jgi:hypothetical protein